MFLIKILKLKLNKGEKMNKEVVIKNAKKVGGILLVVFKYMFKALWVCFKGFCKALWWILKNFKFKSSSMFDK